MTWNDTAEGLWNSGCGNYLAARSLDGTWRTFRRLLQMNHGWWELLGEADSCEMAWVIAETHAAGVN